MPLYFIEMGQGIVANGDLRVRTSTLYSCTLIAGRNAQSGYGGAYHYPAEDLDDPDVLADMDRWVSVLRPTAVTLIFAPNTGVIGTGTSQHDRAQLQNWVMHRCGFVPTMVQAVAAGMQLLPGGMNAGSIANFAGGFGGGAIQLHTREAGTYDEIFGRFTLVGEDREH